jgi:hypothetical protein
MPDGDNHLRYLVTIFGTDRWPQVARYMPDRTVRHCRERWK